VSITKRGKTHWDWESHTHFTQEHINTSPGKLLWDY